jgi:hypothetical protein
MTNKADGRVMEFQLRTDGADGDIEYVPKRIAFNGQAYPSYFTNQIFFENEKTPQFAKNVFNAMFDSPTDE